MNEVVASTIEPELLLQAMQSGRAPIILDVRDDAASRGKTGRIPGARVIPMHQLIGRCEELASHRAEAVVVVSGRGFRSRVAAHELRIAGFLDVRSLEGGMARWLDLGYPVERTAAPTRPHDVAERSSRLRRRTRRAPVQPRRP